MAGHGGLRPGAGAPRGGISETRRLLVNGIKRGLAQAGRAKGLTGSDDDVAVESVARIASDLILSGQGRDVLAIFAQVAAKGDEPGAGDPKSPLQQALARMPGLQNGTGVSLAGLAHAEKPADSRENDERHTDHALVTRSDQPFFCPQQTLIPPHLEPAHPVPRGSDSARALVPGELAAPAHQAAEPPHPPPRGPREGSHLETENFEKNRGTP